MPYTKEQAADAWAFYGDLLEARAYGLKEQGLEAAAIALIGAATDAEIVAGMILREEIPRADERKNMRTKAEEEKPS